jgi:hypothetical protein
MFSMGAATRAYVATGSHVYAHRFQWSIRKYPDVLR